MPVADTGEDAPSEYGDEGFGDEDFGLYDYEDWDREEGDEEPSLALPPGLPADAWPWDLIEPSLENGEAVLPDLPPEEAAVVLAEPLPEPVPPDLGMPPLPDVAEEPSGDASEESPLEEPPDLAGEEPLPEEEPRPEPPPPPPRIVRPSEPIPPPPARETIPMPPASVPDLPARNPPVLTPIPEPPPGVSSRVVRALAGQTVEVPFRGTGWVYLGEASSKRGLDYASRRLDPEGQTFVFRAAEAGVYELKFYRQDFIRDYIINDAVTVIVEEPPQALSASPPSRFGAAVDRGVAVAEPRWPVIAGRTMPETGPAEPAARAGPPPPDSDTAGPATRSGSSASGAAGPSGVPGLVAPGEAPAEAGRDAESVADEPSMLLPPNTAAEEYVRRAREEYQGERYPQSVAILDQFLERFPLGSDEAYWLYAQICEKQGPSRNIRLALDYYRRLTAEYPQSSHYREARRRIAWLERYYINIQ
jgi:hypothetical protein